MSHDTPITGAEFVSEHLPTFGRSAAERAAREFVAASTEHQTTEVWEATYEQLLEDAEPALRCARIEYTVETRRGPVRRAREVSAPAERFGDVVEREIDKLVDRGGFNFNVRYEA